MVIKKILATAVARPPGTRNHPAAARETAPSLIGILAAAVLSVCAGGCGEPPRFAVAYSRNRDAFAAGRSAAEKAIDALGESAPKGLVFAVYVPRNGGAVPDPTSYLPDAEAEKRAAEGVSAAAGSVQNIGIRARPLVPGLKAGESCVAVLAMGGKELTCRSVAVPILQDRKKTGAMIGGMVSEVTSLKLVLVLSEMGLSFHPTAGANAGDFAVGMSRAIPKGTVLFGGNGMNNPDFFAGAGLKGAQFFDGKPLEGYVVAMGIGGNLSVRAGTDTEFSPAGPPVTVTESAGRWILSLDGTPAADVYRDRRGMPVDETFTSDWMHPVGRTVGGDIIPLMILNWTDGDGFDKDGRPTGLPPGALRVRSAVTPGTQLQVLKGGGDSGAITDAARRCTRKLLDRAGGSPLCLLAGDCCMRGMRFRIARGDGEDAARDGPLAGMGDTPFPLFGFRTFGGFGPLRAGEQTYRFPFRQNTFAAVLIAAD